MREIIRFLQDHVDGRTVYTEPLRYELEGGALEGVYSDQMSFSNLKTSQSGFQLDLFVVSNEKIYEGTGEDPSTLRKDFSGVSLFRFEMARRKSSGDVTGFFRFISASGREVPAEAIVSGIYGLRLHDAALTMEEDQILYRDQPVQAGRFKAVAFRATHRFSAKGGLLHYEYDGESFDVDGTTLARSVSTDRIPPFRSRERG